MSFNSNIGADNYLNFTIGAAGGLGNGDYTIAVLVKPAIGNNNCGMFALRSSTTLRRALLEDTNKIFGENEFGGFGTLTQGNWYLCIVKAVASSIYSYDLWPYAADGSGSMSHGDSAFSASAGGVGDNMRIGWGINRGNGDFAAVGLWDRKITNGEADTLKSNLLSTWADLSPVELISFEDWDGTAGSETVHIGSSACSSITGACANAADPPSFDFSTSTAVDLTVADASQAQTADTITLTQVHQLVVADAAQAQSADGLVLTQVHVLSPADAVQSQMADNVTLTQVHNLVIQSARQLQRADTIGNLSPLAGTVSGAVTAIPERAGSVSASAIALAGIIE